MTNFPIIPPLTDHDHRVRAQARAEYEAFAVERDHGLAHFFDRARVEYVERGVKALTPVEVGYVHGSRGIWPADFVAACERRLNREADAEVAENDAA